MGRAFLWSRVSNRLASRPGNDTGENMLRKFALAALVSATPAVGHAFTYTEGADFPNSISFDSDAVNVGIVSTGVNIVNGSLNGICVVAFDCSRSDDAQDSFLFTIPAAGTVTGFTVSSITGVEPPGFSYGFYLRSPTAAIASERFIRTGQSFTFATALLAGTYSVSVFGQSANETGPFSFSYTISMNAVTADAGVPEPATWSMMIAGFGLVGGAMRRRRTGVAFA